jgi:antitoxin component YwqK of YwqJK toxin-antitoxin module
MKKIFLIVTALSTISFFNACTTTSTKVDEDKLYPPVPGYAHVEPYNDGSGLVRVIEYAADGVILEEGYYLNNLREGVYTTFYNNGLVKSTCGYVGGLKQGQEVLFDDRGTVDQRATYHQGVLDGEFVIYVRHLMKEKRRYVDGELNGQLMKFYPNGVLMESSFYKDGQLHGTASWFDQDGTKTIEYQYDMGKLIKEEE